MKYLIPLLLLIIFGQVWYNLTYPKPEPKKLYFEFRKKTKGVTMDGFLRYKGKWCPIVLNDTMAIIYE